MVAIRRRVSLGFLLSLSLLALISYKKLGSFSFEDATSPRNYFTTHSTTPDKSNNGVTSRAVSKRAPPMSCSQVFHQFQSGKLNDPNGGRLYARRSSIEPNFLFSVHNKKYDPVRFSSFEESGQYYESGLSAIFKDVLSKSSTRRVLDVGGNIGWFSLLSAALGAEVSTFEPNPNNYLRICEAMRLNGWLHSADGDVLSASTTGLTREEVNSNLHIFPYGVSEKDGLLYFQEDYMNPGQSKIVPVKTNYTRDIRVVSLDGLGKELGWFDKDIDILKVDVEGAEHGVFLGGTKLLKSGRVKHIFMEGNARDSEEFKVFKELVALLVDSGYVLHKMGHFQGPTDSNVPKTNENLAQNVKDTCMTPITVNGQTWIQQCNLWWRRQ